ncbi:hypothetical protein [Candidatus Liberibacter brunswickensis]|uniref:hypothetical protein n=1 Tax=Candidatus Liberibacter brunswickensis TaxID=1968796 RepID=UPI002FE3CA4F
MYIAIRIIKSIIGKLFYYLYSVVCPICNRTIDSRFCLCSYCWSKVYFITSYDNILENKKNNFCTDFLDFFQDNVFLDNIRSVTVYCDMSCVLVRLLKYHDRTDLAIMMAQWMFSFWKRFNNGF